MPIYEYACARCGATLEIIHSMSAAGPGTHDGCGGTLQRLVSTPITKVGERAAPSGSTDSMLRFRENQKIAAEKKR